MPLPITPRPAKWHVTRFIRHKAPRHRATSRDSWARRLMVPAARDPVGSGPDQSRGPEKTQPARSKNTGNPRTQAIQEPEHSKNTGDPTPQCAPDHMPRRIISHTGHLAHPASRQASGQLS
ncbi:putative protein without homology [Propionibacterium freudenreichii subsp. shermanii]|nr:putative protein without homology [Propionibacterium freudenreichii subsp. shermanii]